VTTLNTIGVPVSAKPAGSGFASARSGGHPGALRVVRAVSAPSRAERPRRGEPRVSSMRQGQSPVSLRLTRRGRAVVAVLLVVGMTIAALLISLAASGGAQATSHGQARAGYSGMREIVVQPGQTLWSIASAADPSADPRLTIQEIMSANALTSTSLTVGELLWVPR